MQSLEEVDNMTLEEYQWRMKAYSLQRLDQEYFIHKQAYLNHVVQATKERGRKTVPVYPTFDSFFDHKAHERAILGQDEPKKEDKHSKMKHLVLLANMKGGQDE